MIIVCACASVDMVHNNDSFWGNTFKFNRWYQHTIHRNFKYHFCSAISKDNFIKCRGFDERYSNGLCYDDINFTKRVSFLNVVPRDDLLTYHINHHRDHFKDVDINKLENINKLLWESQLQSGEF